MKTDRKTTITAVVGILVFIASRYGIELPGEVQMWIAIIAMAVFAYFAGDKKQGPPKSPTLKLPKTLVQVLTAFVLCFSVILTGCTREQVQNVHNASKQIVDKLKINSNIPQLLLDEKLITQEVYEQLTLHFRDAISIASQFRDDLAAALQTNNPGALSNLVPTLANLIAMVNLLKIQGHENLAKLSKFLSKLESLLRVISVFFTQEVRAAKANPLLKPIVESLNQSDVRTITECAGE